MRSKVVLRPDLEDGGYNVSCPALAGRHSQGETVAEALSNIQEAILGCLEVLNERARPCRQDEQVLEVAVGRRVWVPTRESKWSRPSSVLGGKWRGERVAM